MPGDWDFIGEPFAEDPEFPSFGMEFVDGVRLPMIYRGRGNKTIATGMTAESIRRKFDNV